MRLLRGLIDGVVLTVAVGLASGAFTAQAAVPAKYPPSRPGRIEWKTTVATVRFDITTDRPVLLASINGQGHYRLAVDTGETGAVLDDDVVRELRLPPPGKTAAGYTADSDWRVPDVVRVESLTLGGAVFMDLDVSVRDLDLLARARRAYDGVLGLSVFEDCLLTVDYLRQRIRLTRGQLPPADGQDILEYHQRRGLAALPISLGNVTVEPTIDTGSLKALLLPASFKGMIELLPRPQKNTRKGARGGKHRDENRYVKGTVSLGRHKLVEPPIQFHKNRSVLGQMVLHRFAVTFDQKNKRVRFVRNDRDPISFGTASRFGFVLRRGNKGLTIARVVPGSPAARRGLVSGDVILIIDGRPATTYDELELRTLLQTAGFIILKVERSGFPLLVRLDAE